MPPLTGTSAAPPINRVLDEVWYNGKKYIVQVAFFDLVTNPDEILAGVADSSHILIRFFASNTSTALVLFVFEEGAAVAVSHEISIAPEGGGGMWELWLPFSSGEGIDIGLNQGVPAAFGLTFHYITVPD